jgi:hypothetical protein
VRFALLRSAPLRFAQWRYAEPRSAPLRFAPLRCAEVRCAPLRSAPLRFAELRFAEVRCAPLRSAELRSASGRCGRMSGFALRHSFQASTPFLSIAMCSSFAMEAAALGEGDQPSRRPQGGDDGSHPGTLARLRPGSDGPRRIRRTGFLR